MIFVFVIIYLIIISVYGDKYTSLIDRKKKLEKLLKYELIRMPSYIEKSLEIDNAIKFQKKISYQLVVLNGIISIITAYIYDSYLTASIILLLVFIFIMYGIYWLKGGSVLGSFREKPEGGSPLL